MTEKRYYAHKHLLQENKVHDKICHNFMNVDETVEHMNNQYWKYKQLKEENEQLKEILGFLKNDNAEDILNVLNSQENKIWELKQENEQLKHQNELLSDELEQCRAVIDKQWSEYLKKKEGQKND